MNQLYNLTHSEKTFYFNAKQNTSSLGQKLGQALCMLLFSSDQLTLVFTVLWSKTGWILIDRDESCLLHYVQKNKTHLNIKKAFFCKTHIMWQCRNLTLSRHWLDNWNIYTTVNRFSDQGLVQVSYRTSNKTYQKEFPPVVGYIYIKCQCTFHNMFCLWINVPSEWSSFGNAAADNVKAGNKIFNEHTEQLKWNVFVGPWTRLCKLFDIFKQPATALVLLYMVYSFIHFFSSLVRWYFHSL